MLEKKYLTKLEQEGRDIEGKLLSAGTSIIRHLDAPSEFMQDSPENRELFEKKNRAWSEGVLQEAYFPGRKAWKPELVHALDEARRHSREFCSAIDQNVGTTRGTPLPDTNLPPWLFALPYMPKIRKIEQVADLSSALVEKICASGNVPVGIALTEDWKEALESIQQFHIYELKGHFGRFHVVSVFAFPLGFSADNQPRPREPDSALLDAIQTLYDNWQLKKPAVNCTFFTIASSSSWPEEMTGTASKRSWTALSVPLENKRWNTSSPPQFTSKLWLRNFLEALRPETNQERVVRIKAVVDEIISSGYQGNILLEKIAKETPYRRTMIRYAFQELQESGHYECYRVKKDIAIRDSTGQGGIIIHPQEHPFVKYRLGILIPAALGVAAQQSLNYITSGNFQVLGFLIIPPFVYAGKCLEIIIKRSQADL